MNPDSRWASLADILVNYSTRVAPGDRVLIGMGETLSEPLAVAVFEAVTRAGGYPEVYYSSDTLKRTTMLVGSSEQVDWSPEPEAYGFEWADAYIGLRGGRNPYEFADIDAHRLSSHRRAMGRNSARRQQLTRWVLVKVPSEAFAQQAETSTDRITDMFFDACLRDWAAERARLDRLARTLEGGSHVQIVGLDTDVQFSTAGRKYDAGDGEFNMPDGEIYTSPVETSVEGTIYFEAPGVFAGRRVPGIRLTFEHGEVVSATSDSNEDFLHEVLNLDDGARRLCREVMSIPPISRPGCTPSQRALPPMRERPWWRRAQRALP